LAAGGPTLDWDAAVEAMAGAEAMAEWKLDNPLVVRLNRWMLLGVTNGKTTIEADSREELVLERSQVRAQLAELGKRLGPLIGTMGSTGGRPEEELAKKAEMMRLREAGLVARLDLLDFALATSDGVPGGHPSKRTWRPTAAEPF